MSLLVAALLRIGIAAIAFGMAVLLLSLLVGKLFRKRPWCERLLGWAMPRAYVLFLSGVLVAATGLGLAELGMHALGEQTKGTVLRKLTRDERDDQGGTWTSRNVEYRFEASKRAFVGTDDLSSDDYARLQPGDPVAVTYMPSDPTWCAVEGNVPWAQLLVGGFFYPILLLVTIAMARRIARAGRPVTPAPALHDESKRTKSPSGAQ